MNWYKIVKAMPLPMADNYPDLDFAVENLNQKIYNETKDPEGELAFLGSGLFGATFIPYNNNDVVVKYTSDMTERTAAEHVMKMQKSKGGFLDHVVGIYEYNIVPNSDNVLRIVSEKVQMLPEEQWNHIDGMLGAVFSGGLTKEKMIKECKEHLKMNGYKYDQSIADEVLDDYYDLLSGLIKLDMVPKDAHSENVGRRANGQMVLLDLGQTF